MYEHWLADWSIVELRAHARAAERECRRLASLAHTEQAKDRRANLLKASAGNRVRANRYGSEITRRQDLGDL